MNLKLLLDELSKYQI